MRVIRRPSPRLVGAPPPLRRGAKRRRPRDYVEWRALRQWNGVPPWEDDPAGFILRAAREDAGLSQADLAERLGSSQQAVAQAERWESNPTVSFLRRWAEAAGVELLIRFEPAAEPSKE
ncbi:MAG TPA: helix-turn-helix transcriptional regulator [Thermoanaerobaculia bacterium]|nr:helix-turn-helix transcriptional regulator [Thermoanaerobaculia bacterium]